MQIDKTNLITSGMFVVVGLVMASIMGVFHAKVDLYPHLSFVAQPPYELKCDSPIIGGETCNVYMYDVIKDQDKYITLKEKLDTAGSNDEIIFHLGGFGGDAHTYLELYNHIKTSKATVTMKVEGHVYSAHAFLAISGDKLEVGDGVYLMFHDVQFDPKYANDPGTLAFVAYFRTLLEKVAANGILTRDELDYMFADPNHQLYIDAQEMKKRFDAHHKDRRSLLQKLGL